MEGQHRNDNKSPQITECQTGFGAISAPDCSTVDGLADACRADRDVRSAAEFCLGVDAMRRNASFDLLDFDPLG